MNWYNCIWMKGDCFCMGLSDHRYLSKHDTPVAWLSRIIRKGGAGYFGGLPLWFLVNSGQFKGLSKDSAKSSSAPAHIPPPGSAHALWPIVAKLVDPLLSSWLTIYGAGPTLKRKCVSVSCLPRYFNPNLTVMATMWTFCNWFLNREVSGAIELQMV